MPEDSTRAAIVQASGADMTIIPGQLIDAIRRDPRFHVVPTRSGATWLECVSDRPESPLSDVRLRGR